MEHKMSASIGAVLARMESDAQKLASDAIRPPAAPGDEQATQAVRFSTSLMQAIHSVNEQDRVASELMAAVDSGRSDDLIGAMLASQQASLSFSMLMQVRNKVVGAMEDLIKLPL